MTAEEILHAHAALLEGHFQLSSGKHSSRYLQCAVALQHSQAAAALGQATEAGDVVRAETGEFVDAGDVAEAELLDHVEGDLGVAFEPSRAAVKTESAATRRVERNVAWLADLR